MISKDEARKMLEEKCKNCDVSYASENDDFYVFNLFWKENGIATPFSPQQVNKVTGEISWLNLMMEIRKETRKNKKTEEVEIPQWMLKKG